jgi:hypothetical protein
LVDEVALLIVRDAVVKRDWRGYELSESVKPYWKADEPIGTLAQLIVRFKSDCKSTLASEAMDSEGIWIFAVSEEFEAELNGKPWYVDC